MSNFTNLLKEAIRTGETYFDSVVKSELEQTIITLAMQGITEYNVSDQYTHLYDKIQLWAKSKKLVVLRHEDGITIQWGGYK